MLKTDRNVLGRDVGAKRKQISVADMLWPRTSHVTLSSAPTGSKPFSCHLPPGNKGSYWDRRAERKVWYLTEVNTR